MDEIVIDENEIENGKKHGVNLVAPWYFDDECLKFYTKNDIELIKTNLVGEFSLQLSKYHLDNNVNHYKKTGKYIKYMFENKEYEIFEYENCFTFFGCLCNFETKTYRYITAFDYKDLDEDIIYIYKNKYYCQYYRKYNTLFFFNRNEFIANPSPSVMKNIKKAKSEDFVSKYFYENNGVVEFKENMQEFSDTDDEAIQVSFESYYRQTMLKIFKMEKPNVYQSQFGSNSDYMHLLSYAGDDYTRCSLEIYMLYGNDEFRKFCNSICEPEVYKKELLKNGEVRKNLKNNFWIFHEFNGTLRDANDDYIEGEDFTFLIINAIKALEYLLYRKMLNDKNSKKIKYDENITEKQMLDNLIYYIENHKEMFKNIGISEQNKKIIFNNYIDLLYEVKNKCRNGYFHKHRLDSYDELRQKREKVLDAIAKTIILLK